MTSLQSENEIVPFTFTSQLAYAFWVWILQDAVSAATDEERLIKIHDVIQQLPPPHYR